MVTVSKTRVRGSGMVQQVQVLAVQSWRHEFEPHNPHKGGGRELTPQSSHLTSTHALHGTFAPPPTCPMHSGTMHRCTPQISYFF